MLTLLNYLIQIRFRKFVAKGDYLSMLLICGLYVGIAVICFLQYGRVHGWFYLFFTEVIFYHSRRQDLELLQLFKYYKVLIWIEYIFYSLPFFVVLILKGQYLVVGLLLSLYYLLLLMPKGMFIVLKYPFSLLDPFWQINFRRYKLIGWIPIAILLCLMGYLHHNENLVIASFVVIGIIACLPTFERERVEEIKLSITSANEYLDQQLKHEVRNTMLILLPLVVMVCILGINWNYVFWACIIFVLPVSNTILKYTFFESKIKQQLFVFGCMLGFGLLLLVMPLLYKKAINQIKVIKDVES